jgi:anti-anti-sigma regulatory factor
MGSEQPEIEQNQKDSSVSFAELFTMLSTPVEQHLHSSAPIIYEGFAKKVIIAQFNGVISVAHADIFSPTLQNTLLSEAEHVILSLKDVTKTSHTAVGILVDFAAAVLGRGKALYLYQPSVVVEQRLVELNVARFFKILHTDDDLISILPIQ